MHINVLSLLHSSVVVSWQRIHNSLTVTTAYYEAFSTQPNSFLAIILATANSGDSLNFLLQLPTPELDWILILTCRSQVFFFQSQSHCVRFSLYSLWAAPHREHCFLYCCVLINCCRDVFTAQLHSNERGADPQRTPLATPLLLLRDVTAYVTRSSAACVLAIT
jgi:hypothetical protein